MRRSLVLVSVLAVGLLGAAAALAYPVVSAHWHFVNHKHPTVVQRADFSSRVRKINNHEAAVTFSVSGLRASGATTLKWETITYVDGAKASRISTVVDNERDVHKGRNAATYHLTASAHNSPQLPETLCSVEIWIFDQHTGYQLALLANNGLDPHNRNC